MTNDIFNGLGRPLAPYDKGEESWPLIWRLPEQGDDGDGNEPELADKFAHLADDLTLRQALNIWDNGLRLPAAMEGIAAGMIGAHVRLLLGLNPDGDLEAAADSFRDAWLAMAKHLRASPLMVGPEER